MGRGRKKKLRIKGKCQKGLETMIIGIDHGYYAIKSRNFSFPAGVTAYTHEPYTLKNTLQIGENTLSVALAGSLSIFPARQSDII